MTRTMALDVSSRVVDFADAHPIAIMLAIIFAMCIADHVGCVKCARDRVEACS